MSEPVRRTLSVLEYFAARPDESFTQTQIAEACGISGATLSRIVKTLGDGGYIFRQTSRLYRCNVVFRKLIGANAEYFDALSKALTAIVATTSLAAEAIVVRGNEFEWRQKEEHPDLSVQIRAHPGFRRGMNELDSLSRLYLSEIGWAEVERRFDPGTFYRSGARHERVSAAEARRIIEQTDPRSVAFDIEGNGRGVRRFATVARDSDDAFLHILSIAEAACPIADEQEHVRRNIAVLEQWRDELSRFLRAAAPVADRGARRGGKAALLSSGGVPTRG
jgi:DNA-binding IclR family transcriptional regulator